MYGWFARLRRRPAEREFADEVQSHLAHAVDEQVELGLSSDEARTAALRRFGNVTRHLERFRETSPTFWLEKLWQDVRYAVRSSRRSPTFSAAAILTLGLGLGANAALFAITSAVLMNTLPVDRPDELVEIGCTNPRNPQDACRTHYPGFLLFRERPDILSGVFAFAPASELAAELDGRAEAVDAMFLSGNAYAVLGMAPVAGRLLTPADDAPGAPLAAVIGHQFWQRRFGGDTQAIGRSLRMGNQMVTIVGVTPPAFRGLTVGLSPDVTLPMSAAEIFRRPGSLQSRAGWWLYVMGRLKQGVSLDQARVALDPVYRNTLRMTMESLPPAALAGGVKSFIEGLTFRITPAATGGISEFRHMLYQPLLILWGVAALVLLVTCANLAGLLLSRAADRRREFGVRLALGAGPARVARQVITEALVLAVGAGALAVIIARWAAPVALAIGAGETGVRALDIRVDVALLAFITLLSILAGVAIGMGFVRRVLATDPAEAWRSSMSSGTGGTIARTLLVGQMALSIVLLTIAALFVTSLSRARSVEAGFDKEQLITASVLPGMAGHRGDAAWIYLRRILAAAEALPGVRAATYHAVPIGTGVVSQNSVRVSGHDTADQMVIGQNRVGPRFAEALGLRLLRGRDLKIGDEAAANALVNERFARTFFVGTDVLGGTFSIGNQRYTIVGLVADAHDRSILTQTESWVYLPAMVPEPRMRVTVRVEANAATLLPSIERTLQATDRAVPVLGIRLVSAEIEDTLRRHRLLALLGAAFGTLSLALAGIGVYAMFNALVTRRRREIGIRMAIGAGVGDIWRLLAREALIITLCGAGAGVVCAALSARLVRHQLFSVGPTDARSLVLAVLFLAGVTATAVWLPARRATTVNPAETLRAV